MNTDVRKQETIKVNKHMFLHYIITGEISSFLVPRFDSYKLTYTSNPKRVSQGKNRYLVESLLRNVFWYHEDLY